MDSPQKPKFKRPKKKASARASTAKSTVQVPSQEELEEASAVAVRPKGTIPTRDIEALRRMAATDFIADPDNRDVQFHYDRADRIYSQVVPLTKFQYWAAHDKWIPQRRRYWEGIEARVREHMADQILRSRLRDLRFLEESLKVYEELLLPLRDEHGAIRRNETTGAPVFAMDLPSLDKGITMYLKLHERVLVLRGDVTARTEQLKPIAEPGAEVERAPRKIMPKMSREDARAMARGILQQREPALAAAAASIGAVPKKEE